MQWAVVITAEAQRQLATITDRRVREKLKERLRALSSDPELQGKALTGDLAGYRSLRAVEQRYRILYKIEAARVMVYVVAVGLRREGSKSDVYELAKKLLRLGLLEPNGSH